MKLKLNKSIQLRRIAVGVFSLWIISSSAAACGLATAVKDATIDGIRTFLIITDLGEPDCYQARFIVGNNMQNHNILILLQIFR